MQSAEDAKHCPDFGSGIINGPVNPIENIFRQDFALSPVKIMCTDTKTRKAVIVNVIGINIGIF